MEHVPGKNITPPAEEEYNITRMTNTRTQDLTTGPILPLLIRFTIPLVVGNLLELTYNAVDSMIIGRFVGTNALAAVGTSNPLMTLILLFNNGICLGAGILISYEYGAKHLDTLKRQASSGFVAGAVFSILCALVFIVLAAPILRLLQVDDEILSDSVLYLRMVMIGMVFSYIYNYLASLLRAMGDSRSPLYFLAISASLNIVGDLFFVAVLDMGIFGAALSTILCEGISALLCWIYTQKKIPILRLGRQWLIVDRTQLKRILSFGIVSALQQSAVQIGKIATQAMVNRLSIASTAAFNATNRLDDYAIVPEQNMAHGTTSILAQNIGAKKNDRVVKTFRLSLLIQIIYGIAIGVLTWFTARPFVRLFSNDPEVIELGVSYIRTMSWFYTLPAVTNSLQGYFRGIGDLKITLVCSLVNIITRVIACAVLLEYLHMKFGALPIAYAIGWAAMLAVEIPWVHRFLHNSLNLFEEH